MAQFPEAREEDLYKSWNTNAPCLTGCGGELLATLAKRVKNKGVYHYRCTVCGEEGIWEDMARRRRYAKQGRY